MIKLSPPWVNFYHEIAALFEQDPEVKVVYDEENYTIQLYVSNGRKADALAKLLPAEKDFGNVRICISVIPANENTEDPVSNFRDAFAGNAAVDNVVSIDTPFGKMNYVVFVPQVVQYFNDDISDLYGNRTTLFQEIAKDVFGDTYGVNFCTDNTNGYFGKSCR
jgi:hypothetical protein